MLTRSRIVAHRLFGRQGILHLIMYPRAIEGIVSGTGVTGGMFLRISQKWRFVAAVAASASAGFEQMQTMKELDNVDKVKESCPRASRPTGPPTPDQYPWHSS